MLFDLVIRNAHVYAPADLGNVDIAVKGGKIEKIGQDIPEKGEKEIDAKGLIAIPGIIETHAHMSMPFSGTKTMNTFSSGTYAAAFGGVTTLIDFAQQIGGTTLQQSLDDRLEEARERCAIDYGFHITFTDTGDATVNEIPDLCKAGYTSFKLHTTYRGGGLYIDTEGLEKIFAKIAECGGIATVHAENDDMIQECMDKLLAEGKDSYTYFSDWRPDEAEAEAVDRCIRIAKEKGCNLVIRHISSQEAAHSILEAQKNGQPVYAETCPQYLSLTRDLYKTENGREYMLQPPLRGAEDREEIWKAIEQGMKTTIATDACGFYLSQKHMSSTFYGVPGGIPGIETRLMAMIALGVDSKRITVSRLAEMMSEQPAKLYGVYDRKGSIAVGKDADIVLLDPSKSTTIHAAALHEMSDYSPFEGLTASMTLDKTILRGSVLVDGNTFCGSRNGGKLLKRALPVID